MACDVGGELVGLLEAQRNVCLRLQQLARTQRRLITQEDSTRLLALMGERQRLTDELREVSDRVGGASARLDAGRERAPRESAARAEALQTEVRLIVQEILKADESDADLLTVRKQQLKAAMCDATKGQAALSAYRGGDRGKPLSEGSHA